MRIDYKIVVVKMTRSWKVKRVGIILKYSIISMQKNKIINNFYENILQLTTEPLYVRPETETPVEQTQTNNSKVTQKRKNQYATIFSALNHADHDAVIKLETGLYAENNYLKVSGLRMQPSEPLSNAVLASQEGPTLIVNLNNKQEKVSLEGLKFAHLCRSSKDMVSWPSIRAVKDNRYRPMKLDDTINTSILIKKGTLQIDECKFSLAAYKDSRHLCASIIVEEEGALVITRSELLGGTGTIGIYCMGGKVSIRECVFKDHGGIAVWINGGPQTSLICKNSTISKCAEGIVLNGPFCSSVENNNINDCSAAGIITLFGNNSNIINNEIKECRYGIEVQNSNPKVMKNNLVGNKEYGMCSWSRQNGQCWPTLRFNLIAENKKGGLLVWGSKNKSEVSSNLVRLNQKVGIKIDSNAHPHIFLNEVTATFGNGVYICNGGTAFLEKNHISGSLNCNLILEGPHNIDNYIYNNHIEGARGQGIFLLHCEKFLIAKNNIKNNYNGIVCITSVVNIEDNKITNNKCNGIMLVDDCQVLMSQNTLKANRKAGLVCRNSSRAKMRLNRFEGNKIEAVAENGWEGIQDIEEDNIFEEGADIRTPGALACQLI